MLLFSIVLGSSCKGDLFPTAYNCDFKELITSENNKLENPYNLPVPSSGIT